MPRSKHLAPHVGRLSRSQLWAKRGCYKGQKESAAPKKAEEPHHVEKQIGGAKNGGKRLVPTQKAPRYYPADDIKKPKKCRKTQNPTALRSSITPGTILILLAGRFKGKRVVFLKQLESGLLLITGPYKINGVPLRRVNQAYVIATSTQVDVTHLKVAHKINDHYFSKSKSHKSASAEEEFFEGGKPKPKEAFPESKSQDQKHVDSRVIAEIKKTPNLAKYLSASWSLSKGQFPHAIVF